MQTDPISDMLTRIRNAARARHARVELPASKLKIEIARVLKEEGFISTYKVVDESKTRKALRVFLKYTPDKRSVITDLQRVSRPGQPPLSSAPSEIRGVVGGLGINILTTPRGVMTGRVGAQGAPGRRSALRSLVRGLVKARKNVMSRIGRKPIPVPAGVKIQLSAAAVEVQGPKGKLNDARAAGIRFEQKDGVLIALRETEEHRALHGLARALVANAVRGVTEGFKKDLDIVGVGYRAEVKGKNVVFALGYSHPVEFPIPEGIQITVEKQTRLTVTGADRARWAKWRRTSAACARRIRTSRRASACLASA